MTVDLEEERAASEARQGRVRDLHIAKVIAGRLWREEWKGIAYIRAQLKHAAKPRRTIDFIRGELAERMRHHANRERRLEEYQNPIEKPTPKREPKRPDRFPIPARSIEPEPEPEATMVQEQHSPDGDEPHGQSIQEAELPDQLEKNREVRQDIDSWPILPDERMRRTADRMATVVEDSAPEEVSLRGAWGYLTCVPHPVTPGQVIVRGSIPRAVADRLTLSILEEYFPWLVKSDQ